VLRKIFGIIAFELVSELLHVFNDVFLKNWFLHFHVDVGQPPVPFLFLIICIFNLPGEQKIVIPSQPIGIHSIAQFGMLFSLSIKKIIVKNNIRIQM